MTIQADPVISYLGGLHARLERAENEVAANSTPETRKAWWRAYVTYWSEMVATDKAEWIPCPECDGDGVKDGPRIPHSIWDGIPEYRIVDCDACDATGYERCHNCGEHPATTHNKDFDPICAECAGEEE